MSTIRPFVLSIAGFDPCGGAGLLADVKTFEAHGVYGLGVCSAITFQNDQVLEKINWLPEKDIFKQMELLFRRYEIKQVKIGIIENLVVLQNVLERLKAHNPDIIIILDPVLKASTGFQFHNTASFRDWEKMARDLYLITPNWQELQLMYPDKEMDEALDNLACHCHVFLKGGHRQSETGTDILVSEKEKYVFPPNEILSTSKHGSGCVFSSALTANLAKGFDLPTACRHAKTYTYEFLKSNKQLLGYHNVKNF